MEIVRIFNEEEVDRIMIERGYDQVSTNMMGDKMSAINFVKRTDLGVAIHAQVNMKSHNIELAMVELKFMCHIRTGWFDFFHHQFEKYEKILYIYSEACLGVDDIFKKAEAITNTSADIPGETLTMEGSLVEPQDAIEYDGKFIYVTKNGVRTKYMPVETAKKATLEERKKAFWMEIMPIAKQKGLTKEFTMEFYNYWTEHGPNDRTFRKELQQKFDISRRLDTFVRNERKWSKDKTDKAAEKQDADLKTRKPNKKHEDLF